MPPTPYYQDDHVTLYHGDCNDILPHLTDVDLVFTSPPYNLGGTSGSAWSDLADGYADHDDDLPHADYVTWQQDTIRQLWATLSDTGAIFYNHKPRYRGNQAWFPSDLVPADVPLRQIIIWDKITGHQRTHWHFVPRNEWIMLMAREGFRLNNLSTDDVWRVQTVQGTVAHPAPFPLGLPARAIGSCDARLVLDPFAGSGTTLRAAKDAGRKAIGIELSEAYCEVAASRLAQGVLAFD